MVEVVHDVVDHGFLVGLGVGDGGRFGIYE